MKIHLKQIPPHGLHLEGEEDAAFLDLQEIDVSALGPVRYSLEVGLSEGGLFATGSLAIELELTCVSCLEKFRYALRVEAFALQMELGGSETVDLTPAMREDILLALPHYPHCDWRGERVCPAAARLTTDVSSETSESPAWDELDKLKLKQRK